MLGPPWVHDHGKQDANAAPAGLAILAVLGRYRMLRDIFPSVTG
jgi:hypothetical protein